MIYLIINYFYMRPHKVLFFLVRTHSPFFVFVVVLRFYLLHYLKYLLGHFEFDLCDVCIICPAYILYIFFHLAASLIQEHFQNLLH